MTRTPSVAAGIATVIVVSIFSSSHAINPVSPPSLTAFQGQATPVPGAGASRSQDYREPRPI